MESLEQQRNEIINRSLCDIRFIEGEIAYINACIPFIEMAFNIALYDWQKDYLRGECELIKGGRANGKTFTYCVKLALSEGDPIRRVLLNQYADMYPGSYYTNIWFPRYFLETRQILKNAGLPVRDIAHNGKLL